MYIKKDILTLILCFAIAVAAVAVGAVIKANYNTISIKQTATYTYQQSFAELAEELDAISNDLQKSMYVSSPSHAMTLAASVYKHAGAAAASLEELPVSTLNLQQIPTFLNRSGEYMLSLAKDFMNGKELTDDDRQTVQALYEQAKSLSNQMTQLQYRVSSENLKYDDLLDFVSLDDRPQTSDDSALTSTQEASSEDFVSENPLLNMENGLKIPTLNYNGPYSEHLSSVKSVFLADKDPITDDEAKKRAAYILNCDLSELTQGEDLTVGDIKCVSFDGKNSYIVLTMRQGYPLFFTQTRDVSDARISYDEAITKGLDFLAKLKFASMECVFYSESGNILTAEYVFVKNDVYCYPDKITLSVALDNGQILGMNASDYLIYHNLTRNTVPSLTEDAAAKKVTAITPDSSTLCIVKSNGTDANEKLCYVFKGKDVYDEATVYVYINAETGVEEDIQIVYETEEGNVRR